jgi:hypothetical protein
MEYTYEAALVDAKAIANKSHRQAVIVKENGLYIAYDRKEYYNRLPADPKERAKKNKIIEFILPD